MARIIRLTVNDSDKIRLVKNSLLSLRTCYPGFKKWFDKNVALNLDKDREVFLALQDGQFSGSLILKNDKSEKKICTLFVRDKDRYNGLGLDFIKNFRTKSGEFDKKTEGNVCHLFTDGYCYYFAKILEEAYPGGTICKPWPIGHFIYKYNDNYYDIDGEYILEQHDCEMSIPFKLPYFVDEKYMQLHKMDYLHVIDYDNTKVDEVTNYKVFGVTLDKTEMTVLVYLLYNLHCECLLSDEEEFSMIIYYFKWFTKDDYFKVKDIATKLLQSK